jgi:hypothetical protein
MTNFLTLILLLPTLLIQPSSLDIHLMASDSHQYPQVDLFLTTRDGLTPVTNWGIQSFTATTDNGQSLTITEVNASRRPLRILLVVDLTSSISQLELDAQTEAGRLLAQQLTNIDSLGLIVMGADAAQVAASLTSSRESVVNALEALTPQEENAGNTYWDALGLAVDTFGGSPPQTRQVIILMTDISAGGGEGLREENEVINKAREQFIEVYGLYFIPEDDGLPAPNGEISLPPEIQLISDGTGGLALNGRGNRVSDEIYTDENSLTELIGDVLLLLAAEVKLTFESPLPPDGTSQGFTLTADYQGTTQSPVRGTFIAGQVAATPTPQPTQPPTQAPATEEASQPDQEREDEEDDEDGFSIGMLLIPCVTGVFILLGIIVAAAFVMRRFFKSSSDALPLLAEAPPKQRKVVTFAELRSLTGERWPLYEGENTLGRQGSNTVQIRDETVSRQHARIDISGRRCLYADWQASHPTEINGTLLEPGEIHELKDGDTLRIGSTLIRFVRL